MRDPEPTRPDPGVTEKFPRSIPILRKSHIPPPEEGIPEMFSKPSRPKLEPGDVGFSAAVIGVILVIFAFSVTVIWALIRVVLKFT